MTLVAVFRGNPEIWLSLGAIKSATENVPDRTLRNWLKELVNDGAVEARGERKGRRYRLRRGSMQGTGVSSATALTQIAGPHEIFSAESLALVRRIEAPIYTRPPPLTGRTGFSLTSPTRATISRRKGAPNSLLLASVILFTGKLARTSKKITTAC